MEKTNINNDPFAGMQEVPSNWVKWGKVGDWIKGTFTSKREVESTMPGKEGEKQTIYEIFTDSGSFHNIDENKKVADEPTIISKGSYWNIGGKIGIEAQMRNVKPGTIIAMRFTEEIPSKTRGFNPTKKVQVLVGGIDPDYHGQDSTMQEAE